jgi:micrococcal nuclease
MMTTIILFTSAAVLSFSTSRTYAQEDNNCDPSYPDVCISSLPPDLDCDDISDTDFTVLAPDPHGLDSEGDGIGCES